MSRVQQLFAYACVLGAAMIVGNWFLSELRKAKAQNRPWYHAYFFTAPGRLILIALFLLPFLCYFLQPR
jgi:hypothetical protein